jgi:hypothetical protein
MANLAGAAVVCGARGFATEFHHGGTERSFAAVEECRRSLVLRHSDFYRHSDFDIRHLHLSASACLCGAFFPFVSRSSNAMPTNLENLKTIRSQILTELVSLTAERKPTYSVDGQTFSWNDYRSRLLTDLSEIDRQIAAEEPVELHSRAFT